MLMYYSPVRNRRGVVINGGLEKNLNVNKRRGCNKRGGWGWKNCISLVVSCGNLFHSLLTKLSE